MTLRNFKILVIRHTKKNNNNNNNKPKETFIVLEVERLSEMVKNNSHKYLSLSQKKKKKKTKKNKNAIFFLYHQANENEF
jgi:hypothetical protein